MIKVFILLIIIYHYLDQKQPLVGRCKGSPHSHAYRFNRMTLNGYI